MIWNHMAYPKRLSILVKDKMMLGLNHKTKHYVIGFKNNIHVTIVKKNLDDNSASNITMFRHRIEDVSEDINTGLIFHGVDSINFQNVTIDVNAQLVVPKKRDQSILDTQVEPILFEEFIMYPFIKHVGIVIPFELIEDTSHRLVFEAHVVDPCPDIDLFRDNLSNS